MADAIVPPGSAAILAGVSAYEYAELPPIRAARNSLQAMRAMLADPELCGWPRGQLRVIANPLSAGELKAEIAEVAAATTGVLLLYYVGHGVLSAGGELCLSVTATHPDRPETSGLPWRALAGTVVELQGSRAVAQTKMAIHQRANVEGVLCDCVCMGRFYDLFEKREGRWGLVLRQPIYEKDRLDPVDTSAKLSLDQDLLARLPAGYRHLAYLQTKIGMNVRLDLPGMKGPQVEALYAQGAEWLAGGRQ